MSNDDPQKQAGIARLTSDLRAAKIELLSAQCATDRLRLQYSVSRPGFVRRTPNAEVRHRLCGRAVPLFFFR